jgi:hypothetical protein
MAVVHRKRHYQVADLVEIAKVCCGVRPRADARGIWQSTLDPEREASRGIEVPGFQRDRRD